MGSVFCCKIENILGLDFVCQNHRQLRYGGTELIGICRAVVHKQENFNSIYDVEVSISAVVVLRLCVRKQFAELFANFCFIPKSDEKE